MKMSCIPICFFDDLINTRTMSLNDWVLMARRLDLDGVEMYKPYFKQDERDSDSIFRISDMIHSTGLEVSMFTSYADLSQPESSERERQIASIRWDVDAAVTFRTNIVRLTAGRWREGQNAEEILKLVAKGLKASLDYAEEKGVMLALEDHPEIGTRITDFMRILELVDDERLRRQPISSKAISTDGKASKNSALQTQGFPGTDILGKTTIVALPSYRKSCLSYPFHRVLLNDGIASLFSFISSISIPSIYKCH